MASLGEQLRAARRSKSRSLEDISKDTNISIHYLEALEENNYDIFPGPVYVRGFLSTYARYVGLDPKAVLDQYDKLTSFSKLLGKEASENTARRRGTRRVILRRVLLLLIALIIIIVCLVELLLRRG